MSKPRPGQTFPATVEAVRNGYIDVNVPNYPWNGHKTGPLGWWPLIKTEYEYSGYEPRKGDRIIVEWRESRTDGNWFYFVAPSANDESPEKEDPPTVSLLELLKSFKVVITLEPRGDNPGTDSDRG